MEIPPPTPSRMREGEHFFRDYTQGGGSSDSPLPWAIDISSRWDFRSALARIEPGRAREEMEDGFVGVQQPAKMLSPLPVSRNDFMLESTRGQPQATLSRIFEPALNLSCVTVRQTMFSTFSIS